MVSHAAAFFALTFLRLPPREPRPEPAGGLHREMLEGLRWVWQERIIRVTALCAVVLNLFFSALYIVIIVLAHLRGIPAGQIGVMAHKKLSPFVSIASVFWALTVLTPVAIFVRSGYLLGALFFGMALLPPTANTTIATRQLLVTPDHLRGRLSGVLGLIIGGAAALGPVLGGVLMQLVSGSQAILVCTAGIAAITALVTASPTLRHFPRLTTGDGGAGDTDGERAGDQDPDDQALADVPERESAPN
jgi:MFS family permease